MNDPLGSILSNIFSYLSANVPYLDLITTFLIAIIGGVVSGLLVSYMQKRLTRRLLIIETLNSWISKEGIVQINVNNFGNSKIDYLNIRIKVSLPGILKSVKDDGRFESIKYQDIGYRNILYRGFKPSGKLVIIKEIMADTKGAIRIKFTKLQRPEDLEIRFKSDASLEKVDLISEDLYYVTGIAYRNEKTTKGKVANILRGFVQRGRYSYPKEWDPITDWRKKEGT